MADAYITYCPLLQRPAGARLGAPELLQQLIALHFADGRGQTWQKLLVTVATKPWPWKVYIYICSLFIYGYIWNTAMEYIYIYVCMYGRGLSRQPKGLSRQL